MNKSFKSEMFYEFYNKVKGKAIVIDFENRYVRILDENAKIISNILFSKSIEKNTRFNNDDLLNAQRLTGQTVYEVYLDGYDNNHWLWSATITETINL